MALTKVINPKPDKSIKVSTSLKTRTENKASTTNTRKVKYIDKEKLSSLLLAIKKILGRYINIAEIYISN